VADFPCTFREDVTAAAEILRHGSGVSWAYRLLGELESRHELSDLWLVLEPSVVPGNPSVVPGNPSVVPGNPSVVPGPRSAGQVGGGFQLFALRASAASLDAVRSLLHRPPGVHRTPGDVHREPAGVHDEPTGIDAVTNAALGTMCSATFRAWAASLGSAIDPATGISSSPVIREGISRAAACGARYGWSSTLVVLTTGGEAPPEARWLALAAALGKALRSGDEVGVTTPGVALALLGNAGPDAVRPFIARVRAALSAAGWEDVDLHAATARTPEETVDPAELARLAAERLADAGLDAPAMPADPSLVELELRVLPGVVCVAMATPILVFSASPSASLHERVLDLVRARLPHASVRMLAVADEAWAPERAPEVSGARAGNGREHGNGNGGSNGREHGNGNGGSNGNGGDSGYESEHGRAREHGYRNGYGNAGAAQGSTGGKGAALPEESAPRAILATAPGSERVTAQREGSRVELLSTAFDASRGTSEVTLALGARRGTGRAPAGPLAGGAQATLNALSALSIDVPFYLVSAEHAHGVPGEPVVVVLAPKRDGGSAAPPGQIVERLGVATGREDVEAASRATLGALNRHLTRGSSSG
jgi:uncharacterized membrane protein YgcG